MMDGWGVNVDALLAGGGGGLGTAADTAEGLAQVTPPGLLSDSALYQRLDGTQVAAQLRGTTAGRHSQSGGAGGTGAGVRTGSHSSGHSGPSVDLALGVVLAYTAPTAAAYGTATVQLQGAVIRTVGNLPVTQGLPTDLLVVGAQCLVALLDPTNPGDAVVVAVWNAAPARLTQGESQTVAVAAGLGSGFAHVTFPRGYATLHAVVATSEDTSWYAVVKNRTASGFDLYVQNGVSGVAGGGGASIVCDWLSSGV